MKIKVIRSLITFFLLFLISCSSPFAQSNVDNKLDSLFNVIVKKGDFNGSVLVAENGKAIYKKSFGYADIEQKKAINNETSFELASISKQFISFAIMQLEEKKMISFDDKLGKFLFSPLFENVSIRNLLQHTSGIPDFFTLDKSLYNENQVYSNEDILKILNESNLKPNFKPSEKLEYSNTNYVLLVLIIEKVSGNTLDQFMQKEIFGPLKMKNTSVYSNKSSKRKITNYALGYVLDGSNQKYVLVDSFANFSFFRHFDLVNGPFGISSNTDDLLKWDIELSSNKLLKNILPAYEPTKLLNGKLGKVGNLSYGFGWFIGSNSNDKGKKYFHSGGYPGYATMIVRYPDRKKTIILLTNKTNNLNIYELTWEIEDIIFKI